MRPRRALLAAAFLVAPAFALAGDSTLGQKPPEGAKVLIGDKFEGWTDKSGKNPAPWTFKDGVLQVEGGKGDIKTSEKFTSFQLHLEFNVPYMPKAKGQGRGNSGVYLQGIYELQVLDSYGLTPQDNDCGAIYKQIVPAVNACLPPLQWQTYDITFHSAELKDGKVVKKARLTVVQNGKTIIDDKEIVRTPGGDGNDEGTPGPLLLQDHGNPVQFRNVWIKPL